MAHGRDTSPKIYGAVAEFDSGEALIEAARAAREEGYRDLDGYSPIPVHGFTDVIGFEDNKLGWAVLGAGLSGACLGLGLQWWVSEFAYKHNVGGKPFFSWPMFIPVTFECTILLSALTAAGAMIAFNGLPKPHHPLFNAEMMQRASSDRFILCVEATDPNFEEAKVTDFLQTLNPLSVETVWTSEGY